MMRFVGEVLEVDLLTECSETNSDLYQVYFASRSLFIYEKTGGRTVPMVFIL